MDTDTLSNELLCDRIHFCFQAYDQDSGNNSVCLYKLITDTEKFTDGVFYINGLTGDVHCRLAMSQVIRSQFELKVKATDNWGKGHSTEVDLKVSVSDSYFIYKLFLCMILTSIKLLDMHDMVSY